MAGRGTPTAQARAVVTRQEIIAAAVEIFVDHGYAEAKIGDIVGRAGVTTGAFYYHFGTKEALAFAIIAQGWPRALDVVDSTLNAPGPGLERIITMTFALSHLMKQDPVVWISNHLNQAFGELSTEGRREFKEHASLFVERVAGVVRPAELRPGVTPADVGNMVWITVHGCHLLSDAMGDDVIERLARCWRNELPGLARDESQDQLLRLVTSAADEFTGNQRPA